MKAEILRKVEELGKILPANTLDQLIDELGGPENVSEMTGRKGRVVQVRQPNFFSCTVPLYSCGILWAKKIIGSQFCN